MALRLIEMVLPTSRSGTVVTQLEGHPVHCVWHDAFGEGATLTRVLLEAEGSEAVLDLLEKQFGDAEDFRIILLPVEATIPRIESDSGEELRPVAEGAEAAINRRISREELYADVTQMAQMSVTYMAMVALSSIVASFGILRDQVAVIIGVMVIAPLLGPNVALSLATTLGDGKLALRGLKTAGLGLATAVIFPLVLGAVLTVDPTVREIVSRTQVGLGDLALALASGAAGALAVTTGVPATLIGVMVAVALLPPLATAALLAGSGYWSMAIAALLLTGVNVVCVNLAGVATFLIQGVRPLRGGETERARWATGFAIGAWSLLLALLALMIHLARK